MASFIRWFRKLCLYGSLGSLVISVGMLLIPVDLYANIRAPDDLFELRAPWVLLGTFSLPGLLFTALLYTIHLEGEEGPIIIRR